MNLRTIIEGMFTALSDPNKPKDGDRVRHKEHGRVGVLHYTKQHGKAMVKWDEYDHLSSVYPENLEHETPKHAAANDH